MDDVDWRQKGLVTGVKNQGACGSCWAFGATAAHESYQIQMKKADLTIDLSEQQLVDCSGDYGNHGCNGGLASRALEWVRENGQTIQSAYPYKAVNQDCSISSGSYKIAGVATITGCDVLESKLRHRPMAVRVDATNWHLYKSGIFNNCDRRINHSVFMVGSTEQEWTIKNSWGATWG